MQQTFRRRRVLICVVVGLCLVGLLASAPSVLAQDSSIEIDRVSHVDHRLILFDEFDQRYHLSDGRYANSAGVTLVIEKGRIAEMVGCDPSPCSIQAHATRIMKGKLSIYAEIEIPDGAYVRRKEASDASEDVSFEVSEGKIVELQDHTQRPKAAAAPDASAASVTDQNGSGSK